MIKITRVDERLVHGQVAFAWTNSLGADCILVVNDEAAADKIRATTLKLAAPAGIKFSIKSVADAIVLLNGTKTDKYKVFVIVGNTDDALKLVEHVKGVDHINLGNMKKTEGRRIITKSLAVDDHDVRNIRAMAQAGAVVECRAVPTDKETDAMTLI